MVIARRRRRWGLYLPYIVLLVLAAGWSGFWFVARDRAAATLDRVLAREAERGRVWTCPNRTIAGFPFRFELTCELPTFAGNTLRGPIEGRVTRLLALAQIYDPDLVIIRLEGPLTLRAAQHQRDRPPRLGVLRHEHPRSAARQPPAVVERQGAGAAPQ